MRDLSLREASVKWFGKPYTAYTTRPDASRRARAQVELVRPGARLSQGGPVLCSHARTHGTHAGRQARATVAAPGQPRAGPDPGTCVQRF